jgi:hypothetical protein
VLDVPYRVANNSKAGLTRGRPCDSSIAGSFTGGSGRLSVAAPGLAALAALEGE